MEQWKKVALLTVCHATEMKALKESFKVTPTATAADCLTDDNNLGTLGPKPSSGGFRCKADREAVNPPKERKQNEKRNRVKRPCQKHPRTGCFEEGLRDEHRQVGSHPCVQLALQA